MEQAVIKLSYKFKLDSVELADAFNLKSRYNRCLDNIKNISRWGDFTSFSNIGSRSIREVENAISEEEQDFYYDIKRNKPLHDVNNLYSFELSEVKLKLRDFDISRDKLDIDVFCITTELHLIEIIGEFALIKKDLSGGEWLEVLTVCLTNNVTIHKIKAL